MKPSKQLRIQYNTDYSDRSHFASQARLLQSMWRIEQGYDFENYGNFLPVDFAKQTGANYLTASIFELVKHEVAHAQQEGKVISAPRIWNNLLSSQPLAFNLFGELKLDTSLASSLFKSLYPVLDIVTVTNISFEHSPGRRNLKYTGDSSAFDVFIEYTTSNGDHAFFGIEVKYAEHLKDLPSSHKARYEEIATASKIFNLSLLEQLKEKPLQQIWRDHLLTLSLFISNHEYVRGDFLYVYPAQNTECTQAISKYQQTFLPHKESYFKPLTIEHIITVLKNLSNAQWIRAFEDRYLNFDKITKNHNTF